MAGDAESPGGMALPVAEFSQGIGQTWLHEFLSISRARPFTTHASARK